MRLVIQRTRAASVIVDDEIVGRIDHGALILLAIAQDDTEAEADYLAGKVSRLRIYDDAAGKLNSAIHDTGGSFLVVSQFTLYGNCVKGNRPSYIESAPPEKAQRLYEYFVHQLRQLGHHVETGIFQAAMSVQLVNEGPVTLILERTHAPAERR